MTRDDGKRDGQDGEDGADARRRLVRALRRSLEWVRRNVPPGLRLVLGLLLMLGGVLGALPILGFWMFPLGVAVVALDVRAVLALFRRKRNGK